MADLPACESGLTELEVKDLLFKKFLGWMHGQTVSVCEGQRFDHHFKAFKTSCGGVAHGTVYNFEDVYRFADADPAVID